MEPNRKRLKNLEQPIDTINWARSNAIVRGSGQLPLWDTISSCL